ncbi:MAG: DUF2933 domain-containing protein [Aestuariivirga sp.]|nr:DUF2933 domain-containing protein [Aestuariivirga sp.]
MQHTGHQNNHDSAPRNAWSRGSIVLIAFLAIAGFYLIAEHRAHFFGILPFLLLLACPLLHMFMHGGHGGHGNSGTTRPTDKRDGNLPPPPAGGGHQH